MSDNTSHAGTRLRCPKCGEKFTRRKGTTRKFCETCRPPAQQSKSVNIDAPARIHVGEASDPLPAGANGLRFLGEVEEAVAAELGALGQTTSAKAKLALRLARMTDRGLNTGSQLAALSKELRLIMDELHELAVPAEEDPSAELARRRVERQAAAERQAG